MQNTRPGIGISMGSDITTAPTSTYFNEGFSNEDNIQYNAQTSTNYIDPSQVKPKRYVPLVSARKAESNVFTNANGQRQTVYFQMNTKNQSFLDMHYYLKAIGIKNNKFFLILFDKDLANVDPYDPNLPIYMKQKIFVECQRNYFYYIREVVRVQSQGGPYVRYKLDRGNLALNFCFTLSLNVYHEQPRQTGKTVGCEVWYSWVYNFGSRNANMVFLNKKLDDAKRNLDDMKKIIQALPTYLRFDQAFGQNGKKIKARNTVSYVQHPINYNRIEALARATSKTAAISLLRGRTITNCWLDESAFFPFLGESLSNAMPAMTRAFKNCRDNGAPHGLCLTSTPGFISDDFGKYMYDMKCNMTKFSELWYDLSLQQLTDILNANEKSIFVHIRTTYQQLGYSEEWFKERCREQEYKWVDIRREFLLEWAMSAENSPFTKEQLDIVGQLVRQPKKQVYINNYILNVYEELKPQVIPIIGCDVAAGYNKDSSAMSIIDSTTSKLMADFNCNYISTIDFARVIYDVVTKWVPNALVVVERNGVGTGVLAKLVKSKIKSNLYYEIKERTIEERYDGVHINRKKQLTRVYGLDNTKMVREQLMDLLMLRMEDHKDKFVSPIIYEELKNLEVKKNGRIDHSNQSHDDTIFSFLMALYPLYYGKNVTENWGIKIPNLQTEQHEAEEPIFQDFEATEGVNIASGLEGQHERVERQLEALNDGTMHYTDWLEKQREEDEEAMRRILSNPVGQRAYAQKYNIPLSAVQENQPMQFSTVAVMDKFYADMNDPYSTVDDDDDNDVYNDWDF